MYPELPGASDSMVEGGIYALVAETPPARFPLMASLLSEASRHRSRCTLVVPTGVETLVERLGTLGFPDIESAIDNERVSVFLYQDNFNKKMFRFGADSFVSELVRYGIPPQNFLIFDQADDVLSLHDISMALEQIETLRQWAQNTRATVLLVFTRAAASSTSMATLTGLMDQLSGVARIGGHNDGLQLSFDYWKGIEGTVAARSFPLAVLDNGRYQLAPPRNSTVMGTSMSTVMPLPEEMTDDPQAHFFYTDGGLSEISKSVAGVWQHCGSMMGVIHASIGLKSPTVLLTYDRQSDLKQLAESVHTLRVSLGRRARIVVIEKNVSLRYTGETLLLKLGTNLVVHRDVPTARMPLLLESLQGQTYDRDVVIDFEQALASIVQSPIRGYIAPPTFLPAVASVLDRADVLKIPNSLIRARARPGLTPAQLLGQLRLSRNGDFLSNDGEHWYLFFGACPESSLETALTNAFQGGAQNLFASIETFFQPHVIRETATRLSLGTPANPLPDYTDLANQFGNAPTPVAAPAKAVVSSAPVFTPRPTTGGAAQNGLRPAPSFRMSAPAPIEPAPVAVSIEPQMEPFDEPGADEVESMVQEVVDTKPPTFVQTAINAEEVAARSTRPLRGLRERAQAAVARATGRASEVATQWQDAPEASPPASTYSPITTMSDFDALPAEPVMAPAPRMTDPRPAPVDSQFVEDRRERRFFQNVRPVAGGQEAPPVVPKATRVTVPVATVAVAAAVQPPADPNSLRGAAAQRRFGVEAMRQQFNSPSHVSTPAARSAFAAEPEPVAPRGAASQSLFSRLGAQPAAEAAPAARHFRTTAQGDSQSAHAGYGEPEPVRQTTRARFLSR